MSKYVDEVIYQHNWLTIYNNISCGYRWGQYGLAHRNKNWRDRRKPLSFLNPVTPNYPRTSLKLGSAEKSKNLLASVIWTYIHIFMCNTGNKLYARQYQKTNLIYLCIHLVETFDINFYFNSSFKNRFQKGFFVKVVNSKKIHYMHLTL